ncbi:hypothetical protein J6590_062567 [Homalodisca vitripennis]|nr:hypothetical protein J6590_062567 [Homalodisca vitripennis]
MNFISADFLWNSSHEHRSKFQEPCLKQRQVPDATIKRKLQCPIKKLFVSFIMRAFTSMLKDALLVRWVGVLSDLAFL